MFLQEKFTMSDASKWAADKLPEYPLKDASGLKTFYDVCQSVFIAAFLSEDVYLKKEDKLYKADFRYINKFAGDIVSKADADNLTKRLQAKGSRAKAIFNFTVVGSPVDETDGKPRAFLAELIVRGDIAVVNADGSENNAFLEKLKLIYNLCSIAAEDPENYTENAKAFMTKTADAAAKAERGRVRAERAAIRRELDDAYESEDEDRIAAAQQAVIDLYAVTQDEASNEGQTIHNRAVKEVDKKDTETLEITDVDSFILGWLAANVDYMSAAIPVKRRAKGQSDYSLVRSFERRYPDSTKAEKKGAPGYVVVPEYDERGRWAQQFNEYHVHFKRGAVQRAPQFVRDYLGNFESRRTGTGSIVQGNMSSNTLAAFLWELGFKFGLTDVAEAREGCRAEATVMTDFETGYAYDGTLKPTKSKPAEKDPYDDDYDFFDTDATEFPDPVDFADDVDDVA